MSIYGRSYGSKSEGELYILGKKITVESAKAALDAGIGYVSEDRKNLGLILIQDVKSNISISSLNKLSKFGVVSSENEILEAEKYKTELKIKTPSINQLTRNLSGGNQQKVVLSRCLLANPDIFIVDEPTRGIDVGAKTEIHAILNDLVAQGKSIIMVTSELPEAIGMADRIYVMNEGRIKGMLMREEATQEKIYANCLAKLRSYYGRNYGKQGQFSNPDKNNIRNYSMVLMLALIMIVFAFLTNGVNLNSLILPISLSKTVTFYCWP